MYNVPIKCVDFKYLILDTNGLGDISILKFTWESNAQGIGNSYYTAALGNLQITCNQTPTKAPSTSPTITTGTPTETPSKTPTKSPTPASTGNPTRNPTTHKPTKSPTTSIHQNIQVKHQQMIQHNHLLLILLIILHQELVLDLIQRGIGQQFEDAFGTDSWIACNIGIVNIYICIYNIINNYNMLYIILDIGWCMV